MHCRELMTIEYLLHFHIKNAYISGKVRTHVIIIRRTQSVHIALHLSLSNSDHGVSLEEHTLQKMCTLHIIKPFPTCEVLARRNAY